MEGPEEYDTTAEESHWVFGSDQHFFDGRIITVTGEVDIQKALMSGGPI